MEDEKNVLGYGRDTKVIEVVCKGVNVALKRIDYSHRIKAERKSKTEDLQRIKGGRLAEIGVLKKLEHHHVVRLVGTYSQDLCLGLLIWPVAQCDLAFALESIQMNGLSDDVLLPDLQKNLKQYKLDPKELRAIVGNEDERIWASFGCLATAVNYLHENNIRHKDLKPSNILLSRDGIWITDFGSSKDFTPNLTSTSESWERGTLEYCAPEVLAYDKSGRSADIFSLGCVFLEMIVVLSHKHSLEDLRELCPDKNGYYGTNLTNLPKWLALAEPTGVKIGHLADEIERMLRHDRFRRPTAKALSMTISGVDDSSDTQLSKRICGPCCNILDDRKAAQDRIATLEAALTKCKKLNEEALRFIETT
ncbi:kinase-like domain-containing protein [Clohesyomyces aquaticus]|uniref:Kinase-like domain-containing protein n=1 Tax=Clohesyomyces aquaticus TaxID=1231657 RepID=A0A1Y1Z9W3_9PLEO|nr:kinase-like domain-containing protein [Clohesyomyces aquaticus]